MRAILEIANLGILSAKDFPDFPDVEETGATLAENASLKARAVWQKYHVPSVADDTGLEVDFLGGAPGVYSARFAGENCTFDDNNRKLIELLKGVPAEKRGARFKTSIAFIDYEGNLHLAEGVLEGAIADKPSGRFGFGYDPIFVVAGTGKSLAQFPPEKKNSISHRYRALLGIRSIIVKAMYK